MWIGSMPQGKPHGKNLEVTDGCGRWAVSPAATTRLEGHFKGPTNN
jgi:hypothetical protein